MKTATQKLAALRAAKNELKRAIALVTPDVAPQTALRLRAALKSLDGAIRHAERMERAETPAWVDSQGTPVWTPSKVGCYWTAGPYTISTRQQVGCDCLSCYVLTRNREEIASATNWAGAAEAARIDLAGDLQANR